MSEHYEKSVMIVDEGHRAVCPFCGVRHELDPALRGRSREVRIGPCAPCAVREFAKRRARDRYGMAPLRGVGL